MLSEDALRRCLRDLEAGHVERTESVTDKSKSGQAICAFANDMPGRQQTGVLFVGVRDNGDRVNVSIGLKSPARAVRTVRSHWNPSGSRA